MRVCDFRAGVDASDRCRIRQFSPILLETGNCCVGALYVLIPPRPTGVRQVGVTTQSVSRWEARGGGTQALRWLVERNTSDRSLDLAPRRARSPFSSPGAHQRKPQPHYFLHGKNGSVREATDPARPPMPACLPPRPLSRPGPLERTSVALERPGDRQLVESSAQI